MDGVVFAEVKRIEPGLEQKFRRALLAQFASRKAE
jgi:hypothetical protein